MIETETEWLLYMLASSSSAKTTAFTFSVADTYIMRNGVPAALYRSSKSGAVKRKEGTEMTLSSVKDRFCNGYHQNEMPIALTYAYKPS